eukprot:403338569
MNREKSKGSIFDRSWRDRVDTVSELDDKNVTKWQKFKDGRYSFDNIGRSFARKLAQKQEIAEFIEDRINNKDKYYDDERDKLLLKKAEMKILVKYNYYRFPYFALSLLVCVSTFFNQKIPKHFKIIPIMILGGFNTMFHHQIGMYGVYKKMDEIVEVLTEKEDTQIAKDTKKFLEELKESTELKRQKQLDNANLPTNL